MYKKLLPICLVFIIPLIVFAQNKQSNNAGSKERVVLVTVEKVSEGMTSPTMMITGSAYFSESSKLRSGSRKCRQSVAGICAGG